MKGCLKAASILLIICAVLVVPQAASAALRVVAEPGADPAHVAIVQQTADTFNAIISAEMGITLDSDVRIFVCPTRESYRNVLRREFGQKMADADRNSRLTAGMSNRLLQVVAVKLDPAKGASAARSAYNTAAHELFHQVQGQLGGSGMDKAFYWVTEGTADLIGATVAARIGYQSLEKWQLDRVNTLRQAEKHVSPQDIRKANIKTWTTFAEQKQHPGETADLFVFYLMQQAKAGGYRTIADYYRLLGRGVDNETAFQRAFGLASASLDAGFKDWFADLTNRSSSVEVIPSAAIAPEAVADVNGAVELARRFFTDTWGGDLQSSMRLVLAADRPAYAAAIAKEFGVSETEAEQWAKTSTLRYVGSTAVYNTGAYPTKSQRVFAVSSLLYRQFANDNALPDVLDQLTWLKNGAGDATAAHIVQLSGAAGKDEYRQSWLNILAKAASYPDLAEIATPIGWNEAKNRHGAAVTDRTAALAGLYLLDKYGPAAFNNFLKAVKETYSAEQAFQQTFRLTSAQFYEEFAAYLRATVKKAA